MLKKAKEFQSNCEKLLQTDNFPAFADIQQLIDTGLTFQVDIPELTTLKQVQKITNFYISVLLAQLLSLCMNFSPFVRPKELIPDMNWTRFFKFYYRLLQHFHTIHISPISLAITRSKVTFNLFFFCQMAEQSKWLQLVTESLSDDSDLTLDIMRELLESGSWLPSHQACEKEMARLQDLLIVCEDIDERAHACLAAKSDKWVWV